MQLRNYHARAPVKTMTYKAGVAWPSPRFTVNAGTVVDNLTGLIWAQDGNLMVTRDPGYDYNSNPYDGAVLYYRALNYVTKLNDEGYLGYNDWRLPNVNEMNSLINANEPHNETWLNSQGFINAIARSLLDFYYRCLPDKLCVGRRYGR